MNNLFVTNNVDAVRSLTEQYAKDNNLEFFSFDFNRESIVIIHKIYAELDNACIFLARLNKSSVADSLLKLIETNEKNIHLFAVAKEDISAALKSRFLVRTIVDIDYTKEIERFLAGNNISKETMSDISFYKQLATYTVEQYNNKTMQNLMLIDDICNNFILSTTNLNYQYEYNRLKQQYIL